MQVEGIHIFTTKREIQDGNNPPRRMPKGTKVFITGPINGYKITRVEPIVGNTKALNSIAGVHESGLEYHDQTTASIVFQNKE